MMASSNLEAYNETSLSQFDRLSLEEDEAGRNSENLVPYPPPRGANSEKSNYDGIDENNFAPKPLIGSPPTQATFRLAMPNSVSMELSPKTVTDFHDAKKNVVEDPENKKFAGTFQEHFKPVKKSFFSLFSKKKPKAKKVWEDKETRKQWNKQVLNIQGETKFNPNWGEAEETDHFHLEPAHKKRNTLASSLSFFPRLSYAIRGKAYSSSIASHASNLSLLPPDQAQPNYAIPGHVSSTSTIKPPVPPKRAKNKANAKTEEISH